MIAGIDEAGKGCILGSLYLAIAGVSDLKKLENLGLNDSKKVSPKNRQLLYNKLLTILDFYSVIEITPQEIDSTNLLELEISGTRSLLEKYQPKSCYIDCPHPKPIKYKEALNQPQIELIVEHKADANYLPCMAASILAKVTRDTALKNLGINCSGYPGDQKTIKFLKQLAIPLPSYVRKSWGTIADIFPDQHVKK